MNDQELKRLRKFIVISWLMLLAVLVAIAFWGSYQVRLLNETIAYKDAQLRGEIPYVKDGKSGEQGQIGQSGNNGANGSNGQNGSSGPQGNQGSQGNLGLSGEKGDKGDKGDVGDTGSQGPPGKTVFLRTNPLTLQEECRYAGDTDWRPASECQ